MKRFLLVVVGGSMLSCSTGETNISTTDSSDAGAHESGCGGRGELLPELQVSAESDAGAKVTLSFLEGEPMPPVVGNNSWLFRLELDGEPLLGVASELTVTPFMPDHGHGTPTAVTITEGTAGTYRLEPVHTRMAGYWEIGVDLESPVAAKLVFGVCVE